MPCIALHTGQEFLLTALAHVDCQARTIGAYGYAALTQTGSPTTIALSGLLTIFVALFGIRLMMGHPVSGRDIVGEILRVGIVLTLAFSWPAWRTVGYDLILNGPAEVANAIGVTSGLPGNRNDMHARLQDADDGIVAITVFGSGRLTGDVATGTDIGDSPRGIAVSDQFALGTGRSLFLATIIGSNALVQLGAGILLAIAPLMAGFLFFPGIAGLFFGWLRALAFCALGNVLLLVIQGAELALLYPWINDVLQQRGARVFTPSAPTELLVLTMGFCAVTVGVLLLAAKLTFFPSRMRISLPESKEPAQPLMQFSRPSLSHGIVSNHNLPRATVIAESVAQTIRRQDQSLPFSRVIGSIPMSRSTPNMPSHSRQAQVIGQTETLGSSFRRSHRRSSASADRRDRGQ